MADSWTEQSWINDGLGHNGPNAQIKEYRRQIIWLEDGYRERLKRELREIPSKVELLKERIRALRCRKPQ